jgi:hypothetical protein
MRIVDSAGLFRAEEFRAVRQHMFAAMKLLLATKS